MKDYFFKTTSILKYPVSDPKALELIHQQKPVVLTGSKVCSSALRWNLDFLQSNLGDDKFTVFSSKSHIFKFHDEAKAAKLKHFSPVITKNTLTFKEFRKKLESWKPGDDRIYFQHMLTSKAGPEIRDDFLKFDWLWLAVQQKKNNWGSLTSNLLMVSQEGNITPVHYDEQENLFGQLHGSKRCILFPPGCYANLYPHPVSHPSDRQSQVSFERPDFDKFPRLKEIVGQEAVLKPGDVLYIPMYWWHHIESVETKSDSSSDPKYTVSLNFWYKAKGTGDVQYPLTPLQKLLIMRNVEKILHDALKDPEDVRQLLKDMVLGRYDDNVCEE